MEGGTCVEAQLFGDGNTSLLHREVPQAICVAGQPMKPLKTTLYLSTLISPGVARFSPPLSVECNGCDASYTHGAKDLVRHLPASGEIESCRKIYSLPDLEVIGREVPKGRLEVGMCRGEWEVGTGVR